MKRLRSYLAVAALMGSLVTFAIAEDVKPTTGKSDKTALAKAEPSFDQVKEIKVTGKNKGNTLQTLSSDKDGNIYAVLSPDRYSNNKTSSKVVSEIQVLTPEGKKLRSWEAPMTIQAINVLDDGTVYTAGDGFVMTFDAAGKELSKLELPHIADATKNKDKMLKDAEKQVKDQKDSFSKMVKDIEAQMKKLEETEEAKRTARDKAMIQNYKQQLESYKESSKYYEQMTAQSVLDQNLSRMRFINSVAVTEKDVFVVCGETQGYGFAAWRFDRDLKNPKKVVGQLSGCCGQMDLQCCGEGFLVANNGQKKFIKYDRNGKQLGAWGKAGDKDPEAFGGCCNPMNVRTGASGSIYTSESEGIVKRFSEKGEFQGIVAKAKVTGGCKNVAIAVTPKEDMLFFCDQPSSKVLVFAKKQSVTRK